MLVSACSRLPTCNATDVERSPILLPLVGPDREGLACFEPLRWNRVSAEARRNKSADNRGVCVPVATCTDNIPQRFDVVAGVSRRRPQTKRCRDLTRDVSVSPHRFGNVERSFFHRRLRRTKHTSLYIAVRSQLDNDLKELSCIELPSLSHHACCYSNRGGSRFCLRMRMRRARRTNRFARRLLWFVVKGTERRDPHHRAVSVRTSATKECCAFRHRFVTRVGVRQDLLHLRAVSTTGLVATHKTLRESFGIEFAIVAQHFEHAARHPRIVRQRPRGRRCRAGQQTAADFHRTRVEPVSKGVANREAYERLTSAFNTRHARRLSTNFADAAISLRSHHPKRDNPPVQQPRVSGAVVVDQIATLEQDYGRDVVHAALEQLSTDQREEIVGALPVSWLDVETVRQFKNAVADQLGMEHLDLQRQLVRKAIARTIHKIWRLLLRQVWDSAIIKRTPILYSKTFDRGEMKLESIESGRATFVLSGWPDIPEYDCVGLATGMEALLDYSGRRGAQIVWRRRAPQVLFEARWKPKR